MATEMRTPPDLTDRWCTGIFRRLRRVYALDPGGWPLAPDRLTQANESTPMISVKTIEKRYGPVLAVDGVSFEVRSGAIVGLLGHNGAGKTTIMKMMTGFLEPTSGSIEIGGIDVVKDRIGVQQQIGYLPEHAPLYPEMLVQEYLLMMAELRSIPAGDRVKAVLKAVHATGLDDWLTRPISTLSKGYRQRVGLAQAILHHPKLLVLDEPTNGLDPVQILEIRALIRELAKDTTIILSTHILSEIEAVCDRVIILIDGRLAADDTLESMLASDRLHLTIGGSTKGAAKAIAALDGVEKVVTEVSNDGRTRFRLKLATGAEPGPKLAELAAEKGWAVYELAPFKPRLEDVFRDLMTAHADSERGAA